MITAKASQFSEKYGTLRKIVVVLFRAILGIMLFIKGVVFIRNGGVLRQVISESELISNFTILQVLIPWIHILGGFFILIGIFTRAMIVIQMPFVIGAIVALYNARNNAFYISEMIFAVSTISFLVIVLIFGDGFYSWKNLIKKEKDIV